MFRKKFVQGLRQLIKRGKLRLEQEWSMLQDGRQLEAWLKQLLKPDWNVFIEGPPKGNSDPQDVLKYLARYLTGGPISDCRIVREEVGTVTFLARGKDKQAGNPMIEVELPGHEFLRRWSLHILPKGFTKTRSYGGYHGTIRRTYLDECRRCLLPTAVSQDNAAGSDRLVEHEGSLAEASLPKCPRCKVSMDCIEAHPRPSWKDVFDRRSYATHHMALPIHGLGRQHVPDD